jgi:cytosolic carboxypeptidase protein 2/3
MIVPMVNPDGVIAGNYRSSFAGHDLNKVFLYPNKKLHPVVYHLKGLVNSQKDKIFSYIDIQGHPKKK